MVVGMVMVVVMVMVMVMVMVLTRHSRRCVFPYRRRHAPNWSGRTPGSQTPGVPATPSLRQRRTLRHRGLKIGTHVRTDGVPKNAAKCSKSPLDSEDLVDEPQLQTGTAESPRNSVLSEPRHLSLHINGRINQTKNCTCKIFTVCCTVCTVKTCLC